MVTMPSGKDSKGKGADAAASKKGDGKKAGDSKKGDAKEKKPAPKPLTPWQGAASACTTCGVRSWSHGRGGPVGAVPATPMW